MTSAIALVRRLITSTAVLAFVSPSAACSSSSSPPAATGDPVPTELQGAWSDSHATGKSYDESTYESYGLSGTGRSFRFRADGTFDYGEGEEVTTGACSSGYFGFSTGVVSLDSTAHAITFRPTSSVLDEYTCGDHTVKNVALAPWTVTWSFEPVDPARPDLENLVLTSPAGDRLVLGRS